MAKNYQITDVLANKKPYTSVYAAYNKNKELCTVKINDLESLDDSQAILVIIFYIILLNFKILTIIIIIVWSVTY